MIPSYSVEGKVAIVTGSSQGIGAAVAKGFGEAGAAVVLVARGASKLEERANEIKAKGARVLAVPADVTDSSQVSHIVEQTMKAFGRIDVLVNCAGGTGPDRFIPLLEMQEEVWDRVVKLNLNGVYLCSRAVGKVMVKQHNGSIINISSGAATVPVPNMAHYCAAKSGVNQFTRVLAMEFGPSNVRVNAISPGLTDTPTERRYMPDHLWKEYAKPVPLGRVGLPEDFVGLSVFFASDASSYISGVVIPVAGGYPQ